MRKDITAGLKILGDEQGERERKWEEENRELREIIKNLERKLEKLMKEEEVREIESGRNEIRGRKESELESRIKMTEKKIEWKEKGDRKKNIVIRRVEIEKGGVRRRIEKVIGKLEVDIKIEDVRKVGTAREGERGTVVVTLGSREQKRQVMKNKNKLRGREERIDENLIWEERRIRWKLRKMARREEKEDRRVRIGQGGLQTDGKWWKWSEEEEGVLKRKRGEVKDIGMRKDKEEE